MGGATEYCTNEGPQAELTEPIAAFTRVELSEGLVLIDVEAKWFRRRDEHFEHVGLEDLGRLRGISLGPSIRMCMSGGLGTHAIPAANDHRYKSSGRSLSTAWR